MMFMLFFIWGAWMATVGIFMTHVGMSEYIGWAYSTTPIAAIVTPFFMGVFADRVMNAEKLQGLLLIASGVLIAIAPQFASPDSPRIFVAILLLHALCFMPTLGLSNTICLKHLVNAEKEYPIVRVFATLGWIVAGLVVSKLLKADASPVQFYVAAGAAFIVGIYSFYLPKTPPPAKGQKIVFGDIIGAGTLPYFKKISFAVFMFASLLACTAMMPYWANLGSFLDKTGIERPGAFLTMGQMAELLVLAVVLPLFIRKFGIKWTMVIGLSCWIVRFFLFSMAAGTLAEDPAASVFPLLLVGVLLHGFAYDFVFVSGYLYVDKHVKEEVRAQAQGLLTVFTQGIGFLLSSQIFALRAFNSTVGQDGDFSGWKQFWLLPCTYLVIVLIFFIIFFKEKRPSH